MGSELLAIAEELLPGISLAKASVEPPGQFHDLVLVPGVAAIRIARWPVAARRLERRAEFLSQLADSDLPFDVPRPLGPVRTIEGRTAVATAWIDGDAHPRGSGDALELRNVIEALRWVDVTKLADNFDVPRAYAGRAEWLSRIRHLVVPRFPRSVQADVRQRITDALELPPVHDSLVHGDLGGASIRWRDGQVTGVLGWDFASAGDSAIDVASLAWYGWDAVRMAADHGTYRRAVAWYRTFGLEEVLVAIELGEPQRVVNRLVSRTVMWLDHTARLP